MDDGNGCHSGDWCLDNRRTMIGSVDRLPRVSPTVSCGGWKHSSVPVGRSTANCNPVRSMSIVILFFSFFQFDRSNIQYSIVYHLSATANYAGGLSNLYLNSKAAEQLFHFRTTTHFFVVIWSSAIL